MVGEELQDWIVEYKKCIESPYHFYTNYIVINGKNTETHLTESEFNEYFNEPDKYFRKRKHLKIK